MKECTREAKEKEGEFDEMANSGGMVQKDFIFIRLPVSQEIWSLGNCVTATQFPGKYRRSNYATRPYFLGNIAAARKYCRACAG